jgi:predicted kinase
MSDEAWPDGEPAWLEALRTTRGPCVVLLCGLTGAGKTTLATRLERTLPALRFTVDEWMIALFGQHLPRPDHDERLSTLSTLVWDTARRALGLGVHVILDQGFWRRAEREATAERVRAAGATPIVVYLEVPMHELHRRLARRNAAAPAGTYEITAEMLTLFASWFEAPDEDEGARLVRIAEPPTWPRPGGHRRR